MGACRLLLHFLLTRPFGRIKATAEMPQNETRKKLFELVGRRTEKEED